MTSVAALAQQPRSSLARLVELALPVGVIASVLVILVPLPAMLMDMLLAANITAAVMLLLATIYVRSPLELSVFPSLLLATTLSRLVLNVATTRLILTRAQTDGLLAAGGVVKSFGEFVAGDRVLVGLVIFAIIVVIQFVVITKGATRISEVAARFSLDGMPGRQVAIDADLSAGLIDQHEAQRRRQEVAQQADFYGAMDGASKFVRGDAIAGVIITLINIVGGLFIGIAQNGMNLVDAGDLYTRLTIGDGLVTQIPAFLISLAAGLLLTRSTRSTNLAREIVGQLVLRPQALLVAGAFLCVLTLTSLPRLPLLLIGCACVGLAAILARRDHAASTSNVPSTAAEVKPKPEQRVEDYLAVDPLEVEIGLALVRLADASRGGDLLERIQRVRASVAADIGILLPKVRVRDNLRLAQNQFRIKISEAVVAEGTVYPSKLLAVDHGSVAHRLEGVAARDPVSGRPAVWIESARWREAEMRGYRVVEPCPLLASCLAEAVRRHADEILSRDAVKHLVDELRKSRPAVVEELIPDVLKLAEVQQVLQALLSEQVPIRQLGTIFEALGDHALRTRDPLALAEHVRRRLARNLSAPYRDAAGHLHVVTLAPELEDRIGQSIDTHFNSPRVTLSPSEIDEVVQQLERGIDALTRIDRPFVLLVSPAIRRPLRSMIETRLPQVAVLAYDEITRDTPVHCVAVAGAAEAALLADRGLSAAA